MRADLLLLVVTAMALYLPARAKETIALPDMNLVEYVGTFEAEKGNEIDPLLLDKLPAVKHSAKTPASKKGKRKEMNHGKRKGNND